MDLYSHFYVCLLTPLITTDYQLHRRIDSVTTIATHLDLANEYFSPMYPSNLIMIFPVLFHACLFAPLLTRARVLNSLSSTPKLQTRDVTSSSKAGLAWANGRWVDMSQYETTGKVSWCVPFFSLGDVALMSTLGTIRGRPIPSAEPASSSFLCFGDRRISTTGRTTLIRQLTTYKCKPFSALTSMSPLPFSVIFFANCADRF